MKIFPIVMAFLVISLASADIQTSNKYYYYGTAIYEDLSVHNVPFSNSVKISSGGVSSEAEGSINNEAMGWFENQLMIGTPSEAGIGSRIKVLSEDANYKRTFSIGGGTGSASLSYHVSPGDSEIDASYFNPHNSIEENIYLENSMYDGLIRISPNLLSSSGIGRGESLIQESSGFSHNIYHIQGNKWSEIRSNFESSGYRPGGRYIDEPLTYSWEASSKLFGQYGTTGIDIDAKDGSGSAKFTIEGNSSELFPIRFFQTLNPATRDWIRQSKGLYITYEIAG